MPDYSKRHYNQFATIFNDKMTELNDMYEVLTWNEKEDSIQQKLLGNMQAEGRLQLIQVYRACVKMFQEDNPRFNAERFAKACGDEYKNNKIMVTR